MRNEEFKALTASIRQMSKDHVNLSGSIRTATDSASSTRSLWKTGNRSFLIKAGLALIVFPEPIVSDMLGTTLLAAGAVHEGIKRQSVYLDDLPGAFKSAMKDLKSSKDLI